MIVTALNSAVVSALSGTPPPASGDWIITEPTFLDDETVRVQNGGVIVEDGASLSLNSSTLIIGSPPATSQSSIPSNPVFKLTVKRGGVLLSNHSTIKGALDDDQIDFQMHGNMSMNDSLVRDLWGDMTTGIGGIQLYTRNARITNSTIEESVVGIYLPSTANEILVVDDDGGATHEHYYTDALALADYKYQSWNRQTAGSPPLTTLTTYTAVLWLTGSTSASTLDATDRSTLTQYLNGGGRLFISGQGIGYELDFLNVDDPFFNNYLHADFVSNSYADNLVTGILGIANDPISDSVDDDLLTTLYTQSRDVVVSTSGGTKILNYDASTSGAGVRFSGGHQLVYLSFGFETIEKAGTRNLLMQRAMEWMNVPQVSETNTLFRDDFEADFPQPGGWTVEDLNTALPEGIDTWAKSVHRVHTGASSVWSAGSSGGKNRPSSILADDFESSPSWTTGDSSSGSGTDTWGQSAKQAHGGDKSFWASQTGSQEIPAQTTEIFREGFESTTVPTGWSVGDEDTGGINLLDYWGSSDYRQAVGARSMWCAWEGNNIDGPPPTSLNRDVHLYDNDMDAFLTRDLTGLLSGYDDAVLAYQLWYKTENGYDFLYVQYRTTPTGSWTTLQTFTGGTGAWSAQSVSIPLTAVQLRFLFDSDGAAKDEGAYVDDVALTGTKFDSVFAEDFENVQPGWTAEDLNTGAGLDYWGTTSFRSNPAGGFSAWSAQIGTLSGTEASTSTTIFADGFTGGLANWQLAGTSNQFWTSNSVRSNTAPPSAKSTPSTGNYANNVGVTMTKDVGTALSGHDNGKLTFYVWQNTESGFDYFNVKYYDSVTASYVQILHRSGSYQTWQQQVFTLPSTATKVQFEFTSDGSVSAEGVYVDDVLVEGITKVKEQVFTDDFEDGLGGWTLAGTSGQQWSWSTARVHGGTHSAKSTPFSSYSNNVDVTITKNVDLSKYKSGELKFWLWLGSESSFDFVSVRYFDPGTNTYVQAYSKSGSVSPFQQQTVSIPATATKVQFRFTSDTWVTGEGAYVDDVVLNGLFEQSNSASHVYDNSMNALLSRAVSLSSFSKATLSYDYFLGTQDGVDSLSAEYFSGTSWTVLKTYNTDSGGWKSDSVSLPVAATKIGFRFTSSSSVTAQGAYLDNIGVKGLRQLANADAGNYDNDQTSFAEKVVDLTGYETATLTYWYWLDVEDPADSLSVEVTKAGVTTQLRSFSDGFDSKDSDAGARTWSQDTIDLTPYVGGSVTLRFLFKSDGQTRDREGAYIDDLSLSGVPVHVYDALMDARMTTQVNLAGQAHATLSYWFWLDVEDCTSEPCDSLSVEASTTGATWTQLKRYSARYDSGDSPADKWTRKWFYDSVSLDSYVGATAKFRFRFISDTFIEREGAYLDDLKLRTVPSNLPATSILIEGNTVKTTQIGISLRESSVTLDSMTIEKNDQGVLAQGGSAPIFTNAFIDSNRISVKAVGSSPTLSDSVIQNSTGTDPQDIVASGASVVHLLNTFFDPVMSSAADTSTIESKHDITVIGLEKDGKPIEPGGAAGPASVSVQAATGETAAGSTGAGGKVTLLGLTQVVIGSSGATWHTPHHLVLTRGSETATSVNFVLDSAREIRAAIGGDADLDGAPDPLETAVESRWVDAPAHRYLVSQVVKDPAADPLGGGKEVVRDRWDGKILNGNTFPNLVPTNYVAVVKARLDRTAVPGVAKLRLTVSNEASAVTRDFLLGNEYRWFTTPAIAAGSNGALRLSAGALAAPQGTVLVAGAGLVPANSFGPTRPGQVTDPLKNDTDDDFLFDGAEVHENTFWVNPELHTVSTAQLADNLDATGSLEVRAAADGRLIDESKIVPPAGGLPVKAGTHRLYAKARLLAQTSFSGDIGLAVFSGPLSARTYYLGATGAPEPLDLTSTGFDFVVSSDFDIPADTTVSIEAVDLKPGGSANVALDSLLLLDVADVEITKFTIDPSTTPVDQATLGIGAAAGWSELLHVKVPEGARLTSATFGVHGTDEARAVNTPLGVAPVKMSADGPLVAFIGSDSRVYVYNTEWDAPDPPLEVSTNDKQKGEVDIQGTRIIWTERATAKWDIRWRDVDSFGTPSPAGVQTVPTGGGLDVEPHVSLWESRIAYDAPSVAIGFPGIFVFDVDTGFTAQPVQSMTARVPDLYENRLVWLDGTELRFKETSKEFDDYHGSHLVIETAAAGQVLESPELQSDLVAWSSHPSPSPTTWTVNARSLFGTSSRSTTETSTAGFFDLDGSSLVYSFLGSGNRKLADLASGREMGLFLPCASGEMAVAGHKVACTDSLGRLTIVQRDFRMDVGNDLSQEWVKTGLWPGTGALAIPEPTSDLAEAMNAYLATATASGGFYDVPIRVSSQFKGELEISSFGAVIGAATDPLARDTDSDGLDDGVEVLDRFGESLSQFEDATWWDEWSGAALGMFHARGVSLTSSIALPVGVSAVTDGSTVRVPVDVLTAGLHRLRIEPDYDLNGTSDVQQLPVSTGTGYTAFRLEGKDFALTLGGATRIRNILTSIVHLRLLDPNGEEVGPEGSPAVSFVLDRVTVRGNTGLLGVQAHARLDAEYSLKAATQYALEVTIDPPPSPATTTTTFAPPPAPEPSALFAGIEYVKLLGFDNIRVEGKGLDPLRADSDSDGLPDGLEAMNRWYPLNNDVDDDGLRDGTEVNTPQYRTNPTLRDSDFDGIRDGVELACATSGTGCVLDGAASSRGSYIERLARFHDPYLMQPVPNTDAQTSTATNPNNPDTDGDGLPDGWTDGWSYVAPIQHDAAALRFNSSTNRLKDISYFRYDEKNWRWTGETDMLVQPFEGEDLNLDGQQQTAGTWDFKTDTLEVKTGSASGAWQAPARETDPNNGDGDGDSAPDGYEAWFATREPLTHSFTWTGLLGECSIHGLDPTRSDARDATDSTKFDCDLDQTIFSSGQTSGAQSFVVGKDSSVPGTTYLARAVPLTSPYASSSPNFLSAVGIRIDGKLAAVDSEKISILGEIRELDRSVCIPLGDCDPEAGAVKASFAIPGGQSGWYRVDTADFEFVDRNQAGPGSTEFDYFLILRYGFEVSYNAIGGSASPPNLGHYVKTVTSGGGPPGWSAVAGSIPDFQLYTYTTGGQRDFLNNRDEYVVGTNPKEPNTDHIFIGTTEYMDGLLDGEELGRNLATPPPEVLMRTEAARGALEFGGYASATWFDYNGYYSSGFSAKRYAADGAILNPASGDRSALEENIPLFTLQDGSTIYLSPLEYSGSDAVHKFIYVWEKAVSNLSKQTGEDGVERIVGKAYRFVLTSLTPTDLTTLDPAFRNREVYLSNPSNWDTDSDGFGDGSEIDWSVSTDDVYYAAEHAAGRPANPGDTVINVRDRDSDNDGLEESTEADPLGDNPDELKEFTTGGAAFLQADGKKNMVDADADNDGLLDGQEPRYSEDLDLKAEPFNTDSTTNVFDWDSDGDLIKDGFEVDPYVYANDLRNLGIGAKLVEDTGIVSGMAQLKDFDVSAAGDLILLYSDPSNPSPVKSRIDKLKAGYDDTPDQLAPFSVNGDRLLKIRDLGTAQPSAIAVNSSGEVVYSIGSALHRIRSDYVEGQDNSAKDDLLPDTLTTSTISSIDTDSAGNIFYVAGSMLYRWDNVLKSATIVLNAPPNEGFGRAIVDASGNLFFIRTTTIPPRLNTVRMLPAGASTGATGTDWSAVIEVMSAGVTQESDLAVDSSGNLITSTPSLGLQFLRAKRSAFSASNDAQLSLYNQIPFAQTSVQGTYLLGLTARGDVVHVKTQAGAVLAQARFARTDPTKFDSDGDALADGFEPAQAPAVVAGYQAISWDKNQDGVVLDEPDPAKQNGATDELFDWRPPQFFGELGRYEETSDGVVPDFSSHSSPVAKAHSIDQRFKTDQLKGDIDSDGVLDGAEVGGFDLMVQEIASFKDPTAAPPTFKVRAQANPLATDTDFDGLSDRIEFGFTDPSDRDSDNDGLGDAREDANGNGQVDAGETVPTDRDSDDDYLADGWIEGGKLPTGGYGAFLFSGDSTSGFSLVKKAVDVVVSGEGELVYDGPFPGTVPAFPTQNNHGKEYGEHYVAGGTLTQFTNPRARDTDGDGVTDGLEYVYLWRLNIDYSFAQAAPDLPSKASGATKPIRDPFHDSDGDGTPDIKESDSDNDGLSDGQENFNHDDLINARGCEVVGGGTDNPDISNCAGTYQANTLYYEETDPTDRDSDGDGLLDSAEPNLRKDAPADNDPYINSWDYDSNSDAAQDASTNRARWDYSQVFVVLRTDAALLSDGTHNYDISGTRLAVDPDGYVIPGSNSLALLGFRWGASGVTPAGGQIPLTFGQSPAAETVFVATPEGYRVQATTGGTPAIYIELSVAGGGVRWVRFDRDATITGEFLQTTSAPDARGGAMGSYAVAKQETYDGRPALASDTDFDGLENEVENALTTSTTDRDSDDDGLLDGEEVKTFGTNPKADNSDGDLLHDATEVGRDSFMLDYFGILQTNPATDSNNDGVKNYVPAAQPATRTDPTMTDTDGDGMSDSDEDRNRNGRRDVGATPAAATDESNPLDYDTDDDGVRDGREGVKKADAADSAKWFADPDGDGLATVLDHDSDSDGLLDGLEVGLTDADLTLATDLSKGKFRPDKDPSTTTDPTKLDTDGDGVPDAWIEGKYLIGGVLTNYPTDPALAPYGAGNASAPDWWEGEDRDLDGARDANETDATLAGTDSDGDGLTDGPDVAGVGSGKGELVPFQTPRTIGDVRDIPASMTGSVVLFTAKQYWSTDPLNTDSDGDGLKDGDEVTGLTSNPIAFDTDSDQLSDGQEVRGWQVTIIFEKTKDQKEQRTVHSDPLIVNTDGDKKWDDQRQNKVDFADFDEFLATSDPQRSDTDGDGIPDGFEAPGGSWQVEGQDPQITSDIEGTGVITFAGFIPTGAAVRVHFMAKDNGLLDKVRMFVAGYGWKEFYVKPSSNPEDDIGKEHSVDFEYGVSLFDFRNWQSGLDFDLELSDRAGNGITAKDVHADSIFAGIVKAIIKGLKSFVDKVIEAASIILKIIYAMINSLLEQVFKPFIDMIASFVRTILDFVDALTHIGEVPFDVVIGKLFAILSHPLLIVIQVISLAMLAIQLITTGIGIGALIIMVAGLVVGLIIGQALGGSSGDAKVSESAEPEDPGSTDEDALAIVPAISSTDPGNVKASLAGGGSDEAENTARFLEASMVAGLIGMMYVGMRFEHKAEEFFRKDIRKATIQRDEIAAAKSDFNPTALEGMKSFFEFFNNIRRVSPTDVEGAYLKLRGVWEAIKKGNAQAAQERQRQIQLEIKSAAIPVAQELIAEAHALFKLAIIEIVLTGVEFFITSLVSDPEIRLIAEIAVGGLAMMFGLFHLIGTILHFLKARRSPIVSQTTKLWDIASIAISALTTTISGVRLYVASEHVKESYCRGPQQFQQNVCVFLTGGPHP